MVFGNIKFPGDAFHIADAIIIFVDVMDDLSNSLIGLISRNVVVTAVMHSKQNLV